MANTQQSSNSLILTSAQRITQASVFDKRNQIDLASRRTKIVVTLGPATATVDAIVNLLDAGANLCLFNLAHGNQQTHLDCLQNLKTAESLRPGSYVGRVLDIPGSELRTRFMQSGLSSLELKAGQELNFCSDLASCPNKKSSIACSKEDLCQIAQQAEPILVSDGNLMIEVTNVSQNFVSTRVCNDAVIGDRQKIHLTGQHLCALNATNCTLDESINFAVLNEFDFIAVSYIHHSSELEHIRAKLKSHNSDIKIIVKIEDEECLHDLESIISNSEGIILERGDLGMDIPVEKVFLLQKVILGMCNTQGKPAIVGGQLLQSMLTAPRPTRAEVSDIANAVLDGCDGVLLSSETAIGQFPTEAVSILARTCLEAELCQINPKIYKVLHQTVAQRGLISPSEALCSAAVEASVDANVHVICLLTKTGQTPQLLAKYRPPQIILSASPYMQVVRQMSILRGVHATLICADDCAMSRIALYKSILQKAENSPDVAISGVHAVCVECDSDSMEIVRL